MPPFKLNLNHTVENFTLWFERVFICVNIVNYKKDSFSLLDFSKRTVAKILRRANLACSICSWNDASCDIHHIIQVKNGGSDEMDNLICVCPNCHRNIHQNGSKFKTIEQLLELSLDKKFPNWKDYYNPVSPRYYKALKDKLINNCHHCGVNIPLDNKYCSISCSKKNKVKFNISKSDIEEFAKEKLSIVQIAKKLGVSDNAVRKRLRNMRLYEYFYSLRGRVNWRAKQLIKNINTES